jgi:nicotinamide mononucleotide transporter
VHFLFHPAAHWLGADVTPAEMAAFVLSVAMVLCNLRVSPWGWPLAIISSLLYCGLFAQSRLYGDAGLQIFFALLSAWGWWQWLRGTDAQGEPLHVRRMSPAWWAACALGLLAAWPVLGWLLHRYTDTDVPYWDAFPTAASVLGQILLGRKLIENWGVWLVVNLVSIGLYAYKGLHLTVLLYAWFALMSVWGWRSWRRLSLAGAS